MGKKIKVTTTVELTQYQFQCKGCKSIVDMSVYCLAQLSSGHGIVYTCECGHKTNLKPFKKK
jgi:hypothetical protein